MYFDTLCHTSQKTHYPCYVMFVTSPLQLSINQRINMYTPKEFVEFFHFKEKKLLHSW